MYRGWPDESKKPPGWGEPSPVGGAIVLLAAAVAAAAVALLFVLSIGSAAYTILGG